ncbi:MAG: adenylyl-sulfate kinase [Chlorobi bacterium]|nr:adenylyl-sulfate kinase [Chlorobiota bacterium]
MHHGNTGHGKPKPRTFRSFLEEHCQQDLLRFITCGSVDDGKSTLIGRMLWESKMLFDDQAEQLELESGRYGTQGGNLDFALLVDGLSAKREPGITIDVAYRFFATAKRRFIVVDTPGHEQYTRNMATEASTADAAILLVDARKGSLLQTRRHACIVSIMGIRHIVLAINKMDLAGFREKIFTDIRASFLPFAKRLGINSLSAIPISALSGENVTKSSDCMPWYSGPTLMAWLESLEIKHSASGKPVFPVQWVNHPDAQFRGYSGTVAEGIVSKGNLIRVTASGQTAEIRDIITMEGSREHASAGDAVTLLLDREIDISRGDVLTLAREPVTMSDQFEAVLVWMHDDPGLAGRTYELKLATQWVPASITAIKYRIGIDTLSHESCRQIGLNDISVCNIATGKPLAITSYSERKVLGSFILVDRYTNATVAAGMIRHSLRRAANIHQQPLSVGRADREKLNHHKGRVIWLTGLSGSGKSTLANALDIELHRTGMRTYILDGDNIRQGLNRDLGFSEADRVENIRRVAEVARLMMDAGLIVITAFISPFIKDRQMARELVGERDFLEVYVSAPLDVCEERDPKGLYQKARRGEIPLMTGIGSPYEPPVQPDFIADTGNVPLNSIVEALMAVLTRRSEDDQEIRKTATLS